MNQFFKALLISIAALSCKQQSKEQQIMDESYRTFLQDSTTHIGLIVDIARSIAQGHYDEEKRQTARQWLLDNNISLYASSAQNASSREVNLTQIPGDNSNAIEKIHIAFDGMPDEESVKKLIEAVMHRYGIIINNENTLRVANVLVTLKNESKVGVTEMDILKHIYQKGTNQLQFSEQAALSATILETNK